MLNLKSSYPQGARLCAAPLMTSFGNFVSVKECHALITAARGELNRALVSDAGAGVESDGRTGTNAWISHDHNEQVLALAQRMANVTGIDLSHAESFQVVHYSQSDHYAPHYDAWEHNTPAGMRCMAEGGQRMITCLLYLNQVAAGGGTAFPRLNIEISATARSMLLFHNCIEDTTTRHPDSLHSGLPVIQGEKWVCNLWFREKPYRQRDTRLT